MKIRCSISYLLKFFISAYVLRRESIRSGTILAHECKELQHDELRSTSTNRKILSVMRGCN